MSKIAPPESGPPDLEEVQNNGFEEILRLLPENEADKVIAHIKSRDPLTAEEQSEIMRRASSEMTSITPSMLELPDAGQVKASPNETRDDLATFVPGTPVPNFSEVEDLTQPPSTLPAVSATLQKGDHEMELKKFKSGDTIPLSFSQKAWRYDPENNEVEGVVLTVSEDKHTIEIEFNTERYVATREMVDGMPNQSDPNIFVFKKVEDSQPAPTSDPKKRNEEPLFSNESGSELPATDWKKVAAESEKAAQAIAQQQPRLSNVVIEAGKQNAQPVQQVHGDDTDPNVSSVSNVPRVGTPETSPAETAAYTSSEIQDTIDSILNQKPSSDTMPDVRIDEQDQDPGVRVSVEPPPGTTSAPAQPEHQTFAAVTEEPSKHAEKDQLFTANEVTDAVTMTLSSYPNSIDPEQPAKGNNWYVLLRMLLTGAILFAIAGASHILFGTIVTTSVVYLLLGISPLIYFFPAVKSKQIWQDDTRFICTDAIIRDHEIPNICRKINITLYLLNHQISSEELDDDIQASFQQPHATASDADDELEMDTPTVMTQEEVQQVTQNGMPPASSQPAVQTPSEPASANPQPSTVQSVEAENDEEDAQTEATRKPKLREKAGQKAQVLNQYFQQKRIGILENYWFLKAAGFWSTLWFLFGYFGNQNSDAGVFFLAAICANWLLGLGIVFFANQGFTANEIMYSIIFVAIIGLNSFYYRDGLLFAFPKALPYMGFGLLLYMIAIMIKLSMQPKPKESL